MDIPMDLTPEPKEACKTILKLDLGVNGTRRIPYKSLLDPTTSKLSYARLEEIAVQHSLDQQKAFDANNQKDAVVITTYTDEDGDEIRINSDEELADAFQQFDDRTPPVLRAKAEVNFTPRKSQNNAMRKGSSPSPPRSKWQVKGSSIITPSAGEKDRHMKLDVPPKTETQAQADTASCTTTPKDDPNIDPNFIHGRHTCDGCLTTPIFGLRYHATNLPDYDLCSKCFSNYEGSIEFKLDQKAPDQFKQKRWSRRYCKNTTHKVLKTGLSPTASNKRAHWCREKQTRRVNFRSSEDDDIQEAIRRSLHGAVDTVNTVGAAFAALNSENGVGSSEGNNLKESINLPKLRVEIDALVKEALPFAKNTVIDIKQDVKDAIQRVMEEKNGAVDVVLEVASTPPRQEEVPMQAETSENTDMNETDLNEADLNDADLNEAILRSLTEASEKKTVPEVDNETTDLLVQEAIRLSFNDKEQEDAAAATTEPAFTVPGAVEEDIVVEPTPEPEVSESANVSSETQETDEASCENMKKDEDEDEENNDTTPVALVVEEEDVISVDSSKGELVEDDDHVDAGELSDEWDVVADDEMVAEATSKLGSALCISDSGR